MRASPVAVAGGNGVRLWDRSLPVIACAAWSAPTSRRVASLRKGFSRKLRNDVDHLQVKAALLPVAGKRHFEERAVEARSGCCGSNEGGAVLQPRTPRPRAGSRRE